MKTLLTAFGLVLVLVIPGEGAEVYSFLEAQTVVCPPGDQVLVVEWWNLEGTDPANPDRLVFRTVDRRILLEVVWPPDAPGGSLSDAKEIRLGAAVISAAELVAAAPTPCHLLGVLPSV